MNANLYARIAAAASARGESTCCESPGRAPCSYVELQAAVLRVAGALQALGVTPGDRVLVQTEKSLEAVQLYLGCLAAGAVFVPLNVAYTVAELKYFIGDAEPSLLVCDPAREPEIRALAGESLKRTTLDACGGGRLPEQAGAAAPAAIAERAASDLAAIIYTSGTTGRPKGAMLSHANLTANADALVGLWQFAPTDVVLHALPLFHIHGLFVALHCALFSGARTLLLPKFEVASVIRYLPRATVFMGVPTHYIRLLADARLTAAAAANMRLFLCGSAPLLPATFEAFAQRTGHNILERYGMSEAGMIASNPYVGPRLPGTVGYPLPGVEARVVDDEGHESRRGTAGMLEIRGASVSQGYWRRPDLTRAEFRVDGYFVTGDIAEMQTDGRLAIVGRAKDMVISGGLNIYPKEIEREIDALKGVAESAVIGVPHPDFGEVAVAVVVLNAGATLAQRDVLNALEGRLARFKQPKRVVFVDGLPRNALGKLQKAELRTRYQDLFSAII